MRYNPDSGLFENELPVMLPAAPPIIEAPTSQDYNTCEYVATAPITDLADVTHFDFNGATLTPGDRALFHLPGGFRGTYQWTGARWQERRQVWRDGYTVRVTRSAGSPLYIQRAPNGSTIPVFYRVFGTEAGRVWGQSADGTALVGLRDRLNVMMFGAKCDGVTDDSDAIEAALAAAGTGPGAKAVYVPGMCGITRPVQVQSYQRLIGDGETSGLMSVDGFSGSQMVLVTNALSGSYRFPNGVVVRGLKLKSSVSGIKAVYIQPDTASTEMVLRDLWLECDHGIIVDGYMHGSIVDHIYSMIRPVGKLIVSRGNINCIERVYVEGGGLGTDPFITIDDSSEGSNSEMNYVGDVIIEGVGCGGKPPVYARNTWNLKIGRIWVELDYGVQVLLENARNTKLREMRGVRGPNSKLRVTNGSTLHIDRWDNYADISTLADMVEVDSTSRVTIDEYIDYQGIGLRQLGDSRYVIKRAFRRITNAQLADYPLESGLAQGRCDNILTNGSFEAGLHGWTLFSAGFTHSEDIVDSPVSAGKCLKVTVTASDPGLLIPHQIVHVSAEQVGKPIVLSCLARVVIPEGGNNPHVVLTASGDAGVVSGTTVNSRISECPPDGTWHKLVVAVTPHGAGDLDLGFIIQDPTNATEVYVDDVSAQYETDGVIVGGFGSVTIGGRAMFYGASAPTDVTGVAGSICWNSNPSVGQPKGWMLAGGAWVSMGNL